MDAKRWYEHSEGSYWIERGFDWIIYTYEKYNKRFPHLSGKKEIALFKYFDDAERFCKLKNRNLLTEKG